MAKLRGLHNNQHRLEKILGAYKVLNNAASKAAYSTTLLLPLRP